MTGRDDFTQDDAYQANARDGAALDGWLDLPRITVPPPLTGEALKKQRHLEAMMLWAYRRLYRSRTAGTRDCAAQIHEQGRKIGGPCDCGATSKE